VFGVTIHVRPIADLIQHETDGPDCICGPDVEFFDPETGETYADGPLVIHHALDGREQWERSHDLAV
jgi:hypothetical protein